MAKYFQQTLANDAETVPKPAVGPLLGGEPAKRAPIVAAIRAQDRVVTLSRRVLLRQSLSGAVGFLVPNTDPTVANTHPLGDSSRIVARARVTLTPGCMIRVRALVAFSGQTQTAGGSPLAEGAHGGISVLAAFTDSSAVTLSPTFEDSIPTSPLEFAAAPTAAEGQWKSMRVVTIDAIRPEVLNSAGDVNQWTRPSTVELTVSHLEGARVISLIAYEMPYKSAMEADDTADEWCSHHFGSGSPGGVGPAMTHPFQRLGETTPDGDPRGGTWHMMDVANAQALRLGPVLIHWTSHDEDGEDVRMTECEPVEIDSDTLQCIHNTAITRYSVDQEGFSLAAGAYARVRPHNDPVGMPSSGVIPVRVRVYASTGDGSTAGVVRLWSAPYQWIDVVIPAGTSYAWREMFGYARVGRGPGDPAVAQIFARRTSGSSTVRIRAVSVDFAPTS